MKSKKEFLSEYRSKHPEIWIYLVLDLILDIVGAIIIVINAKKLIGYHSRYDEPQLVFFIFLGLFFWILGVIFTCLIKKVESNGNQEYEHYLITYSTTQHTNTNNTWVCSKCGNYNENSRLICSRCSEPKPYAITRQNNSTNNANSWTCPNCGKVNQNYVGTCGCGEVKPWITNF